MIDVLVKLGVPREDASITAQNLVKADLRGIESHGVARLKRYTDGIKNGVVKVHPDIKVIRQSPVTALLDGDSGLGQVVSYRAMNMAIEKAKGNYVGLVGVRNSNHFGIAGFYGLMALEQDLIGLVMTNTRPLVAHTFSKQKLVGTNPICVAVPTGGRGFVLDMATSVAPIGKMEVAKRIGKKVPIGWGIDADGNLTDDPDKISKGVSPSPGRPGRSARRPQGLRPWGGRGHLLRHTDRRPVELGGGRDAGTQLLPTSATSSAPSTSRPSSASRSSRRGWTSCWPSSRGRRSSRARRRSTSPARSPSTPKT